MTPKGWLLVVGAVVFVLALLMAPQLADDPPSAARPDL